MEIERQFLVPALPPLPSQYEVIRQGYVALLPEIRIRQVGDSHFALTVKRGSGLVREEWETKISRQEFDSLAAQLYPGTCIIEKHRYHLPLGSKLAAELHVHKGHLAGLDYVEVEFDSVEEAAAFDPPAWFGREVTEDARFSYGTLARQDGMRIVERILNFSE